ncbi:NAD(P)/FAD-dependent oxidoreductase [Brevibacillus sp. 7WMA2]|uniref:NAD(P)/FAD-dependent oxidoreductase n=1 Tax=Brevibacillus sp. 7WMA2 TaxID=2683193 RepID=UPI0013A78C66|nr:NAD(P)/FAD-dependent oxidoreductase [Brevibacillus sp. 7WMA2]QIC05793.1 NAD(P)/FAD-dependent oxidoreductase [Brevibacillus sp. 7WMA2]
MKLKHVQVLIVGAGMAGISTAIWCKRLGLSCLVIEQSDSLGGQIHYIHNRIWDLPPKLYANGEELLTDLRESVQVLQIPIRYQECLRSIDYQTKMIHTDQTSYQADYVVVATGVSPVHLPQLAEVSAHVLGPEFSTSSGAHLLDQKDILVIGGGDRALESVCNLSAYAHHIWLAVRNHQFRGRQEWVQKATSLPNVTIWMETEVKAAQSKGNRCSVDLQTHNQEIHRLQVDWILPRVGIAANSSPVAELVDKMGGFLTVDEHLRTAHEWIYAIGDITNGSDYASLSLAIGQAMKTAKHIALHAKEA